MNLQDYTEMFIQKFIDTVYNRMGLDISEDVSMEIFSNNQEILSNIYYGNCCWGSIYYGDDDSSYDFILVTLTPTEIETVFAGDDRVAFANYLSILGTFIDSAFFDELSILVEVALPEE